jgi:phage I-like protein
MKTGTALCAAISINGTDGQAPEWLHLLPRGEARTVDGRGPYRVTDAAAIIAASMASGGKLVLDENHATDLAAPQGLPAPARGWIVELQHRADGIWGRVDWTPEGRGIAERREYRGVSPAIVHRPDGTVVAIARASLTNLPNIAGLTALHHRENDMPLRESLIQALGLDGEADDAAIVAAVTAANGGAVALQAALAPIARAAGVAEGADAPTVLAGVERLKGGADTKLVALQSELATVTTTLNAVTEERKRDKATAFVDAAIAAGRVGVKPVRDDYITMHMAEPARAEKLINAMPVLAPGRTTVVDLPTEGAPESPALLSQKAGAYQKKLEAQGVTIDFAAAVRAVHEGKTA